ncbi:AraC family transcriptional regulator [Ramlibacter sp.]|uniref:helix-turn-helix domain-containing protein n=1 Tax=Ramlibacter sp. TaxID=1917967 RepID=UPI00261B751F|nr:AraC family transcriptional regulator [Ramlibacter sp.]
MPDKPANGSNCPAASARAPRVAPPNQADAAHLRVASPGLQGAVLCAISRDFGTALSAAQRLTHLPATPFIGLCCFQGCAAGLVQHTAVGPQWRPFAADAMIFGSQSLPTVCWCAKPGRAVLVLFTADVARHLFGLDPTALHETFEAAHEALHESWWPLLAALQSAPDDATTLAALDHHLAARWQVLRGAPGSTPSIRQIGRHWLERLALQAGQWSRTHSARQVERRIKSMSGRSLREWQTLVRAEGAFHLARDRWQAGQPFDWAGIAVDEGFADQSHLVRAAKRITGFSPTAFAERYIADESFWLYRLWV